MLPFEKKNHDVHELLSRHLTLPDDTRQVSHS